MLINSLVEWQKDGQQKVAHFLFSNYLQLRPDEEQKKRKLRGTAGGSQTPPFAIEQLESGIVCFVDPFERF